MTQTRPKYDIVEVEWFDAQSGFGQAEFIDELITRCEPFHTFSVGYLLNQNKEGVLLGFMLFGDDMVKHNQLIPRGMIKHIRRLKWQKTKRQNTNLKKKNQKKRKHTATQ